MHQVLCGNCMCACFYLAELPGYAALTALTVKSFNTVTAKHLADVRLLPQSSLFVYPQEQKRTKQACMYAHLRTRTACGGQSYSSVAFLCGSLHCCPY